MKTDVMLSDILECLDLILKFMFVCGLIDKGWDPMFGADRWEDP